jgi:undecaprenyl-diphosphatase
VKNIINFIKKYRSYILLIIIALLTIRVFVPKLDELKKSIEAALQADPTWLIFGVLIYWLGLPILTKQFIVIAKKHLPFWTTFKVQVAGLFVGKLLPSSLGTITLNTYYFTVKKHSLSQAASVMAMNSVTSGIAYFALIIVAVASFAKQSSSILEDAKIVIWILTAITILLLIISLIYKIPKINLFLKSKFGELIHSLKDYKNNKNGVIWAILLNGAGSLTSLLALYASSQALGLDATLAQCFIAYTMGNLFAGLVPVPGGIGASEAGLYSAFVFMGFDESLAIATVLVYRLISFWIPTIPGYIAFWNLRKDVLSKFNVSNNKQIIK